MSVNFNGFEENVVTMEADSSVTKANTLVKMKSSGVVEACSKDDDFCGVVLNVRDGYAAVQLKGYVVAEASGTVAAGYKNLACGEGNTVAVQTTGGREHLVLTVDGDKVGFIL